MHTKGAMPHLQQKKGDDLVALYKHERKAQKCISFRLGFETASMISAMRAFEHRYALFERLNINADLYSKHTILLQSVDGETN